MQTRTTPTDTLSPLLRTGLLNALHITDQTQGEWSIPMEQRWRNARGYRVVSLRASGTRLALCYSNPDYQNSTILTAIEQLTDAECCAAADVFLPPSTPSLPAHWPLCTEFHHDLKPGMYLSLTHGFTDELERARTTRRGIDGPLIGPLHSAHSSYGQYLKIIFVKPDDATLFGLRGADIAFTLPIIDGCLVFGGVQYGDWCTATISE